MSKWLWAVALSIGFLQGCATQVAPPASMTMLAAIPPGTPACDTLPAPHAGNCTVYLTVADKGLTSCDITLSNQAGAPLADSDLLTLDVNASKGNFIYWKIINSSTYEFTEDGIAFVDNNRPRMYNRSQKLNATEYQWRRNNRPVRRVNGYVINVIKPNANPSLERECELDPWIRTK